MEKLWYVAKEGLDFLRLQLEKILSLRDHHEQWYG